MGHFSEFVGMPLSSATRVVAWLVNAGYVERLPDPEDRRIVRITLTEEGRTVYRVMNSDVKQHMEQILRRFSLQERKTLIIMLRKVVDVLRDVAQ